MEYNINNEIKKVLKSNAELIEIEDNLFEQVKKRIEEKKVRRLSSTQLAASFMLVITAVILSVPSFRVMATEAIQKIIYVPVKRDVGEGYDVKEVSSESEGILTQKSTAQLTDLSNEELSKLLGIKVKFPETLGENVILVSKTINTIEGREETKIISAEYKKKTEIDSKLPEYLISIDTLDSDLENYGDNIKGLTIKGIKAYYKELPIASNPEVYLESSIKPEGYMVSKEISWVLNGANYKVLALNENISLEDLIEKAEIVMESN